MKKQQVHIINQDFSFDLKFLHCGIESNKNHYRNNFLDCFSFSYIIEGAGELIINKKRHFIKKGDIFVISQSIPYVMRSDTLDPYKYFYVDFYGANSAPLLARCGITPDTPVLSNVNSDFIEQKMNEIYAWCAENTFTSIAKVNTAFYEVLCSLFELRDENNKKISLSKHQFVEQAQKYIQNNYFRDINVNSVCRQLYTNRSYFTTLFKKICGVSLSEYIINYRIDRAMYLLHHSDMPIVNIAEQVGFKDYVNFYKRFKSKTGRSPKLYRNENKKERQ